MMFGGVYEKDKSVERSVKSSREQLQLDCMLGAV